MSETRIGKWLKAAVHRKQASAITLRRLIRGRRAPMNIQTFPIDPDPEEGFSESELAEELHRLACEEALSLGGKKNRFQLQADTAEETNVSEMAFTITNLEGHEETGGFEATTNGLTAQLMLHNEMLTRTLVGSLGAQMKAMADHNLMLQDRLIAAEERAQEFMLEANANHDNRLLLVAETKRVEADAEAIGEIKSQLVKWMPSVLTHIMRKTGGPIEMPAPLVSMLRTITPEQMLGLTEILNPEQATVIGELYISIKDEEDAAASALAKTEKH